LEERLDVLSLADADRLLKKVVISPRITAFYPESELICQYQRVTSAQIDRLFSTYLSFLPETLHYFCLEDLTLTLLIENLNGGTIHSSFDMKLGWGVKPTGFVTIGLGSHSEDHTDTLMNYKHILSHELAHVIIFAYLAEFLGYPTAWHNSKHILPQNCPFPKFFIELLCDTLATAAQFYRIDEMMTTWRAEWVPENIGKYGESYYANDVPYALDFIYNQATFIHHQFLEIQPESERPQAWKQILDYFFTSPQNTTWIRDVNLRYFGSIASRR
jgi:hypothetical protein